MYKTEEWKTKSKKNNETALKSYVLWLETFSFLDYYFDNECWIYENHVCELRSRKN